MILLPPCSPKADKPAVSFHDGPASALPFSSRHVQAVRLLTHTVFSFLHTHKAVPNLDVSSRGKRRSLAALSTFPNLSSLLPVVFFPFTDGISIDMSVAVGHGKGVGFHCAVEVVFFCLQRE